MSGSSAPQNGPDLLVCASLVKEYRMRSVQGAPISYTNVTDSGRVPGEH